MVEFIMKINCNFCKEHIGYTKIIYGTDKFMNIKFEQICINCYKNGKRIYTTKQKQEYYQQKQEEKEDVF